MRRCFSCLFLAFVAASFAKADDWPQWMGPKRDGLWRESGVVASLPAGGAPVIWRAEVAYGYAGPAVAGSRVYLFDYVVEQGQVRNLPSRRDQLAGFERLTCYDGATGDVLWRKQDKRKYLVSYGGGPRCTPTVDEDLVFTLGAEGNLVCRRTRDGTKVWSVSFRKAFGVETPIWGHSAHPLVVGEMLYCVAGGDGSVAVAFDKRTGELKWKKLSASEPGYCPPVLINHAGVDQLLVWHPESLNSMNPATGDLYWSLPLRPSYGMSITQPQLQDDNLFVSAIGNVAVLMKLDKDKPGVEVVWSGGGKTGVRSANVTPLMEPGVIYGVDCETSELMAVSIENGKRLWATKVPTVGKGQRARHGTAFLTRHEPSGVYWLFNEQGELITAKLSRDGYEETGRQKLVEASSSAFGRPVVWTTPAFADRCVFVRNDKELVCVSLAEKPAK